MYTPAKQYPRISPSSSEPKGAIIVLEGANYNQHQSWTNFSSSLHRWYRRLGFDNASVDDRLRQANSLRLVAIRQRGLTCFCDYGFCMSWCARTLLIMQLSNDSQRIKVELLGYVPLDQYRPDERNDENNGKGMRAIVVLSQFCSRGRTEKIPVRN